MATSKWWNAPKEDVHKEMFRTADSIRAANQIIHMRQRFYMQAYCRMDPNGDGWTLSSPGWSRSSPGSGRSVKYNLTSACIDTAASIVAQMTPLPQYDTDLGEWDLLRKTRERTRVLDGQFFDLKAHKVGTKAWFGGAVTGLGAVYVAVDPIMDRPHIEHVMSIELDVDQAEAWNGDPRTLYRTHVMDRERAMQLWPRFKDQIADAAAPSAEDRDDFFLNQETEADLVLIKEAWHLPAYSGSGGGRYVVAVSTAAMVDEEWTRPRFPFAFYRWKELGNGWWGTGIAEEVTPSQVEINVHIDHVLRCQRLMSNAYLLTFGTTDKNGVKVSNVANLAGQHIHVPAGAAPPQWITTMGTPPDLQQQVELIEQRVMRQLGLSQGAMQGMRSPGVTSGVGMRTEVDIKSQRHVVNARQFTDFYLQLAQCLCDANDDIVDLKGTYEVNALVARGRQTFLRSTRWEDLQLPEGKVNFKISAVNSLPQTPEGKLQQITDFMNLGFINRPWAMKLLDVPDVAAYESLENADLDYALWDIERIIDGELVEPDERSDLRLCADIGRKSYLKAKSNGAPFEVLNEFESYLNAIQASLPPDQAVPAASLENVEAASKAMSVAA